MKTPGQIHTYVRVSSNLSVHWITFNWLLYTLALLLVRDDAYYVGECCSAFSVLQQGYHAENTYSGGGRPSGYYSPAEMMSKGFAALTISISGRVQRSITRVALTMSARIVIMENVWQVP